MSKNGDGFSFTSLEDAMRALVSKWIIQALLLDQSNLHIMLRYRITLLQPFYHWGCGVLLFFGCSPLISLPKAGPKFGITSLSPRR